MDFDLNQLGDKRFEHLTQSLAVAGLGPSVEVFGDGPDGGREATFDGEFDLQTGTPWVGYGILQAKYKEHPDGMSHDQTWFLKQVKDELDEWLRGDTRRTRKPEYLILATNVRLSAVSQTGGLDKLDEIFATYRANGLSLKGYQVWHYDKLRTLLEVHASVRTAYAALILPGDIIARLHEQLNESDARIENAWLGHASRALRAERTVTLGESGDAENRPFELEQVAVDLPARFVDKAEITNALRAIVDRADNVLAPTLTPAHKERVVLLGGPGQGKSTIGRLLCQLYRVGMLAGHEQAAVGAEVRDAATRMRTAFREAELPIPSLNRVPIAVPLPAYADEISGGADVSLLRQLTAIVNRGAGEQIGDGEMKRLLRTWPSIIVLDGLDEVPSAIVRASLAERITDFMGEMAAVGADVLLLCTSRPQTLAGMLPPDFYDYLTLERLEPEGALAYASRLVLVRHPHDAARRLEVTGRLAEAAEAPATSKLMETPLQVTVMALLLESQTRAPSSRHRLFSSYYQVIYQREINKPGWVGQLLDRYRSQIDAMHERVALAVHTRAELAGQAESIMPTSELRAVAISVLYADGYTGDEVEQLATNIVTASAERLVLLVPRGDGVGFEVRSLQEFMAARALTSGGDIAIPQRLQAVAAARHWRNTWLLAAGRIFAERQSLRGEVVSIVDRIDDETIAASVGTPGSTLAMEIIDDGLAATAPTYELSLVSSAMRMLDGPPTRTIIRLALTLLPRMSASSQIRERVEMQVNKRATAPGEPPLATAEFLGIIAGRKAGPEAEWARLRRDSLCEAMTTAHASDDVDFEIYGVGYQFPHAPLPANMDAKSLHPKNLDTELREAARADGLDLNEDLGGRHIYKWIEAPLEVFDRTLTDDPQTFRDVVANWVARLPFRRWREAESVRNLLAVVLEEDAGAPRLAAVTEEQPEADGAE